MERVNYLSNPQVINLFIYPDLRDTIKRYYDRKVEC